MNDLSNNPPSRTWPANAMARVPAWIYSDKDLFEREMEKFFFGPTWSYVGLECEVPTPGSYKRSWIGTKQVVLTRDLDGSFNVVENRCAHRGTPVCWKTRGEAKQLTCPYHQWSYDLKGNLLGLPFLRGAMGKGGMPKDFDKKQHGMRKLKVASRGGAIWASFSDDPPPFETYCGPEIMKLYDRMLSGRPLKLLGYSRQILPINWKLYHENIRDPYHATILHSFFVTFGLFRADVDLHNDAPEGGRHELAKTLYSADTKNQKNEASAQMTNIIEGMQLRDMDVVRPIDEFNDGMLANFNVFPSIHIQQHANILSMRHMVPKSVNSMELTWTQLGYADDDAEMDTARAKQANLIGPAGLVSVEDGEVLALLQQNIEAHPDTIQIVEMGGREVNLPSDTMLNEDLLRAFYRFYRTEMDIDVG
jgi:anthranilate 1,2-dioxygenase large subunit